MQGEEGSCRPVSSSFSGAGIGHRGWISPLCSETGFFPQHDFPLELVTEWVYTEGLEEQGLSSENTAWIFLLFPVREGLKFEGSLEEYQGLVDPPQQPCGKILRFLLFN